MYMKKYLNEYIYIYIIIIKKIKNPKNQKHLKIKKKQRAQTLSNSCYVKKRTSLACPERALTTGSIGTLTHLHRFACSRAERALIQHEFTCNHVDVRIRKCSHLSTTEREV